MKILLRLLILFYVCLLPCLSWAQKGLSPAKKLTQYNFNQWDTEHGLPANAVISIMQARNGYIWMASYGGLVCFNGLRFSVFNTSNTPQIISNTFTQVLQHKDGTIWISSGAGGVYAYHNNTFTPYNTQQGLPAAIVDALTIDHEQRLWAGTTKGLCYLQNNRFTQENLPNELRKIRVQSLFTDAEGYVWIGTIGNGVYKFNFKDQKVIHFGMDDGLNGNTAQTIGQTRNRDIWIGTEKGFAHIPHGANQVRQYALKEEWSDRGVNAFHEDINGNFWIGTFNGLARLKDNELEYFPSDHPLSKTRIQDLMQDSEGNLWICTYRNGIFKLSDGIFTNYSHTSMVDDYIAHAIVETAPNQFIIAHEKGISLLDRKKNVFTELDLGKDINTGLVKSVMQDRKGNLWICCRESLIRYKNGQVREFTTKDGLLANYSRITYEDHRGDIWVGTHGGLNCIRNDSIISYKTNDHSCEDCDNVILSLYEDQRHNIWVSTRSGVLRLDNVPGNRNFVLYTTKDGLAGDVNFKIYEEADGTLWIGSNRGLTCYRNGRFRKITTRDGLFSDVIFQVFEDDQGYFWMTTNGSSAGVFKVKKQELLDFVDGKTRSFQSIGYNRSDGMKASESTPNGTGLKASDGTLWLPTLRGVEVLNPLRVISNLQVPPVVIEEVIADQHSYLLKPTIYFPPGRQRIEIRYIGLSFTAPQDVKYKYKLEGYDKEWQDVGAQNQAFYTNLPPGEYTFRVMACNSEGLWSEKGASVRLYLAPFFYQTRWFISLIAFSVMLMGTGVYRWRIRILERAKQHLEKTVTQRTEEITRQSNEILLKNRELAHQKEEILAQHNNIETQKHQLEDAYHIIQNKNKHITDSIRYARTIQHATLPNPQHIEATIGEHFLIYRPKDIVSGDFYWHTQLVAEDGQEKNFVAVVDCTGHGVPGAFMSMIGTLLLSEIVNKQHITEPERIFAELDVRIQAALQQKEQNNSDGMDVCLCLLEKVDDMHTKVTFAGAKRPLYYLPEGESKIQALKGNRNSIGGRHRRGEFGSESLVLKKGSVIYLTTDGFSDQNNLQKEKFGYQRLMALLGEQARLPMQAQQARLEQILEEFMQNADQRDDITLMGIRL